jgi:hypothetical protein
MNIYNLISGAIGEQHLPLPCEPVQETCAVTGERCQCIPRKKLFSSNFTEQPELRCPESQYVGTDVYQALKYPKERQSSWIVDSNDFQLLKRIDVRSHVLNGANKDVWAGWVTTSYKKHGAFRAQLNQAGRSLWAFDERIIDCSDNKRVNEIYTKLVLYLKKGFSRSTLETLQCPTYVVKILGIQEWLNLEKWAIRLYKSNLYKFLCYLLPSQDELKNEGWENPLKKKKGEKLAEAIKDNV